MALYSARESKPAGLVLEGVAPSLSMALRAYMTSKWYLMPLVVLPIERLLAHDYSLEESMSWLEGVPVVIFQGTEDTTTPLEPLKAAVARVRGVDVRSVVGANHSNAYAVAHEEYISTVTTMAASGK